MRKSIKQKMLAVLVTAFLIAVSSPAIAQAPKMSVTELKASVMNYKMSLALTNPKQYAQLAMRKYKWGSVQYQCLNAIWTNESHWNYKAKNSQSTAYGIAQMLIETSHIPMLQIDNGLRYIKNRYGQPCTAWRFWRSHYWY